MDKAFSESYRKSSSYAGVGLEEVVSFVTSQYEIWKNGTSSVEEQIDELNKLEQNEIEWVKSGEWIVPKSIKVCRLSRTSFAEGITIERIFRASVESGFEKNFVVFPSSRDVGPVDNFSILLERQNVIEKFISDSFGKSLNGFPKTDRPVNDYLNSSIADIKSSNRLTLVPRGTILQVASCIIQQSFNSDGYGMGDYDGWVICNGQNGTPDLRGRFLVGQDLTRIDYSVIGSTGGKSSVKLDETNLPEHQHYFDTYTSDSGIFKDQEFVSLSIVIINIIFLFNRKALMRIITKTYFLARAFLASMLLMCQESSAALGRIMTT